MRSLLLFLLILVTSTCKLIVDNAFKSDLYFASVDPRKERGLSFVQEPPNIAIFSNSTGLTLDCLAHGIYYLRF